MLEYCAAQKLGMPYMVSDTISGKVDWEQREIGAAGALRARRRVCGGGNLALGQIHAAGTGNHEGAGCKVAIHVVKNAMVMNGSMQSTVYATIFGLAPEIKRDFVSQHTHEGLAHCKVDGIVLGRPRGVAQKLGLDDQAKKIDKYQVLKLNKRAIAKLLGVSPNTLYAWLRRRRPETVGTGEVAESGAPQPTA